MVSVYDCHSASRSSSWQRLVGEFTCYQNSAAKNSKTIVRCDKKVGQRTERKSRNISMIVEYFSPKIHCSHCLTYWTTGILYWTWRASLLYLTKKTRQMNRERLVTLPIPHYVTKKGPLRGARHGNTERQRIYHAVHIAAERGRKKGYKTILDRFQTCPVYRGSQLAIRWDEAFCVHYDKLS